MYKKDLALNNLQWQVLKLKQSTNQIWTSILNEAQFLPSCGRVDTAVGKHYLDANKTAGEKARRQLHKNVASNIEQVPAAHPWRHQLYGHLPPITKTIRHAGHCWNSWDELLSDILQWYPTYDRAKAVRPARTYIQQLCEDTGCSPEDLPAAMNDREKWWERVRDIRAGGTTRCWMMMTSFIFMFFFCFCLFILFYFIIIFFAVNANDILLLANTLTQAESLLHSMERVAGIIGLRVNGDKTEYMWFNQRDDISTVNGDPLKLEDKFTYWGSSVSSSSCHAITMDIPDPLSPLLPIVHCFRQVLRATFCIFTELLNVDSGWSPCLCSAM